MNRWFNATAVFIAAAIAARVGAAQSPTTVSVSSPDGRNTITLDASGEAGEVQWSAARDGVQLFDPAPLGPVLAQAGALGEGAEIVEVQRETLDETFSLPWGKTAEVRNRCAHAQVTLAAPGGLRWQVELRAYDDGVAFRYHVPEQDGLQNVELTEEATQFAPAGDATALYSGYDNFTSSHEALVQRSAIADIPADKLLEMPLLVEWPDGPAAAITEGRVRHFAGMYLQWTPADVLAFQARLAPLPGRDGVCVAGEPPLESPWRVVLLADRAGQLLESNLLLCLNDPPEGDFSWARPGRTSFHWWYGAFEDDYQATEPGVGLARHRQYIDFCAEHNIAYHGVSGDGRPWYVQTQVGYAPPGDDADVRVPRPEVELPKIIEYARDRGVGIRLWVHWQPLSEHLEEAFALYESWGVAGLMVDFLDRDDQEMIEWTEQMLECAARHHLHIQIHGSSKYSGEQRTFPNLFNREGVLNLEYLKWSDMCSPDHTVNVAYTRALAGPVDYHLGGFRSVGRADFQPRDRAPIVLGTRCHHLALYVVFENPMPMVADDPSAYEGQPGFDFLADVPTTWDETRFLAGDAGEYVVLARRKGDAWYVAGITDWTPREVSIPLNFLAAGAFTAKVYADGSLDESHPNEVAVAEQPVDASASLDVSLAPGGGFVAVIRPADE